MLNILLQLHHFEHRPVLDPVLARRLRRPTYPRPDDATPWRLTPLSSFDAEDFYVDDNGPERLDEEEQVALIGLPLEAGSCRKKKNARSCRQNSRQELDTRKEIEAESVKRFGGIHRPERNNNQEHGPGRHEVEAATRIVSRKEAGVCS